LSSRLEFKFKFKFKFKFQKPGAKANMKSPWRFTAPRRIAVLLQAFLTFHQRQPLLARLSIALAAALLLIAIGLVLFVGESIQIEKIIAKFMHEATRIDSTTGSTINSTTGTGSAATDPTLGPTLNSTTDPITERVVSLVPNRLYQVRAPFEDRTDYWGLRFRLKCGSLTATAVNRRRQILSWQWDHRQVTASHGGENWIFLPIPHKVWNPLVQGEMVQGEYFLYLEYEPPCVEGLELRSLELQPGRVWPHPLWTDCFAKIGPFWLACRQNGYRVRERDPAIQLPPEFPSMNH